MNWNELLKGHLGDSPTPTHVVHADAGTTVPQGLAVDGSAVAALDLLARIMPPAMEVSRDAPDRAIVRSLRGDLRLVPELAHPAVSVRDDGGVEVDLNALGPSGAFGFFDAAELVAVHIGERVAGLFALDAKRPREGALPDVAPLLVDAAHDADLVEALQPLARSPWRIEQCVVPAMLQRYLEPPDLAAARAALLRGEVWVPAGLDAWRDAVPEAERAALQQAITDHALRWAAELNDVLASDATHTLAERASTLLADAARWREYMDGVRDLFAWGPGVLPAMDAAMRALDDAGQALVVMVPRVAELAEDVVLMRAAITNHDAWWTRVGPELA